MSDDEKFYVGYGDLPSSDRRFLLKAVPAGLVGLAASGAYIGTRAASSGGGRWETGTPVKLTGKIAMHPYPILWSDGIGIVLAGIGKLSADEYVQKFEGEDVIVTGVKIVRGDCFMLGVAENDIRPYDRALPAAPVIQSNGQTQLIGEIVDAQCFMGIMNPGYGRSHRGCATQCIRGGQPVYFSVGTSGATGGGTTCNGEGFLLADENGNKINQRILDIVALPVAVSGELETIGNLKRLKVARNQIALL